MPAVRNPPLSTLEIVYSFPHALGAPGIGWTAWNQVAELVAAGHRVHLVAASLDSPLAGLASVLTTFRLVPLRIPHRLLGGRERSYRYHDRIAAWTVRRRRPHVVHAWPLGSELSFGAAREVGAAGLREVPNTHTGHAYDVVAEESARLGLEVPRRSWHAFDAGHLRTEEAEWRAATGLLVPSDVVAETFARRGFAPEKLLRHRYGARPPATAVAARDATDRPLRVVFLGRGEPRKGLHYALEAWAGSTASARGTFSIYGNFEGPYAAHVREALRAPGVRVEGFVGDPGRVLAEADILLLPSLEEGSALVTYEAVVHGCVPLVSRQSGAAIEHDVHGLFHEARDVATLREQLDALDADRPRLARLSRGALDDADRFSWPAAGESLVAAYRRALLEPAGELDRARV